MSEIEKKLLDSSFKYYPPLLYHNALSLRCGLSLGSLRSALKRAREIFGILFEDGPDAVVFNYAITDYSESGGAGETAPASGPSLRYETHKLRFLLSFQDGYRHEAIRDVACALSAEDGLVRNNRMICYSDGRGFDNEKLIRQCAEDRFNPDLGFVSLKNECVMCIYDDRGCDIVFADAGKFLAFYPKLEPYLLDYDRALMEERKKQAESIIMA